MKKKRAPSHASSPVSAAFERLRHAFRIRNRIASLWSPTPLHDLSCRGPARSSLLTGAKGAEKGAVAFFCQGAQ